MCKGREGVIEVARRALNWNGEVGTRMMVGPEEQRTPGWIVMADSAWRTAVEGYTAAAAVMGSKDPRRNIARIPAGVEEILVEPFGCTV